MVKNLFVGGIPWGVTQEQLRRHFMRCGEVVSAKIIVERDSGRSKGFGFVEMASEEAAQAAIAKLNESDWDGRRLVVKVAVPMTPRAAGQMPARHTPKPPKKPGYRDDHKDKHLRGGANSPESRGGLGPDPSAPKKPWEREGVWQDRKPRGFGDKKPWQKREGAVERKPWADRKPGGAAGERKPWADRKPGGAPGERRPWTDRKPSGPPGERKPWADRKSSGPPGERKPWSDRKPRAFGQKKPWERRPEGSGERKPWADRKPSGPPGERKPWADRKPSGPPGERRPWKDRPSGPPRDGKPAGGPTGERKPWGDRKPGGFKKPWSKPGGPPRG